jgi:hypothetical protein
MLLQQNIWRKIFACVYKAVITGNNNICTIFQPRVSHRFDYHSYHAIYQRYRLLHFGTIPTITVLLVIRSNKMQRHQVGLISFYYVRPELSYGDVNSIAGIKITNCQLAILLLKVIHQGSRRNKGQGYFKLISRIIIIRTFNREVIVYWGPNCYRPHD